MIDLRNAPTYQEVIENAIEELKGLENHIFDVITISEPEDVTYAVFLANTISKISSITGNMIELKMASHLNENGEYAEYGQWIRQDPGFPDNIFISEYLEKIPGIEVKAWFPLATEITARFKGSIQQVGGDNTYVALIAWLPEFILHGRPQIIDVWVGPSSEVAQCRDNHYYNPPKYLVVEPQNTIERTINLQQSNVEGYVFQADTDQQRRNFELAQAEVDSWGESYRGNYSPTPEIIHIVNELLSKYSYRQDTNFAKLDRIEHVGINQFKQQVYSRLFHGKPISYWRNIKANDEVISEYLELIRNGFSVD